MAGLKIIGTGHALPRNVVSNDDLGKIIDTNDEWIYTRTGIKTRRIAREEEAVHILARRAAEAAIKKAAENDSAFSKDKIKAVLVATMTSDFVFPSVSCILQKELGLKNDIKAFDLSAACTGFIYAMQSAYELLNTDSRGYVLVVGAECMSRVLNFDDRSTSVLFGDGAGAALVCFDDSKESMFKEVSGSEGNLTDLYCRIKKRNEGSYDSLLGENKTLEGEAVYCGGENEPDGFLHMNGGAVFVFATTALKKAINTLLDATGLTMNDIDMVVCHQANARIINHVKKKFPEDGHKFFMDLEEYANTSAGSVAIALSDMYEKALIRPGMKLILASFGAGLSWNGILMTV